MSFFYGFPYIFDWLLDHFTRHIKCCRVHCVRNSSKQFQSLTLDHQWSHCSKRLIFSIYTYLTVIKNSPFCDKRTAATYTTSENIFASHIQVFCKQFTFVSASCSFSSGGMSTALYILYSISCSYEATRLSNARNVWFSTFSAKSAAEDIRLHLFANAAFSFSVPHCHPTHILSFFTLLILFYLFISLNKWIKIQIPMKHN